MVIGGLTTTLPVTKDIKKLQPKSEAQLSCEVKGGRWDEENQVCILPEAPTLEPTPEPVPTSAPKGTIVTSGDTGKAAGFINSEGQFVAAGREDIEKQVSKRRADESLIADQETASQLAIQQSEAFKIQQQIAQVGQLGKLNPAIQADINFSQALTAGAARAVPGAIGGAAVGATAGLLGGPLVPVTSTVGALAVGGAGLIGGFVSGIQGNIKEQQRGELQAADVELSNGIRNMRQLAMLASQDPSNADIYIQQYNNQLTRIHQSRRQTKAEVTGNLNSFMEDGREQLADFDSFLQPGGTADIYGQKLAIALSSGAPLSINGEDLLIEEGLL